MPSISSFQIESEKPASMATIDVSRILGEDFIELLTLLPDPFYCLPDEAQDQIWVTIRHAAVHGETDPQRLANLYQPTDVTTITKSEAVS